MIVISCLRFILTSLTLMQEAVAELQTSKSIAANHYPFGKWLRPNLYNFLQICRKPAMWVAVSGFLLQICRFAHYVGNDPVASRSASARLSRKRRLRRAECIVTLSGHNDVQSVVFVISGPKTMKQ